MEEDRVREVWVSRFDYLASVLSQTVGLGNMWRFPYLVYDGGGGVFFIPYLLGYIFLGIPFFCLESFVGQFASVGPIAIWEINLLLKGTGYATIVLAIITCLDYAYIISISMWYLFASMSNELPWSSCGNRWNTCNCGSRLNASTSNINVKIIWNDDNDLNCTGIDGTVRNSTSSEYFFYHVIGETGHEYAHWHINVKLAFCILLTWVLTYIFVVKGIKSFGKALYFFAIFPYIVMTAIVVRGSSLQGASKGISYYLHTNIENILKPNLWYTAVSQIFISMGLCNGSLMGLASYNHFNNNQFVQAFIVSSVNLLTSFYGGFITFSVLGFLSVVMEKSIDEVEAHGSSLAFVVYPEVLDQMPTPIFWAISLFAMLVVMGLGTLIPTVHCILAAFEDEFLWLKMGSRSKVFRGTGCAVAFCLNLIWMLPEGQGLSDILDYSGGFPLFIIGIIEIAAFVWIYGLKHISEDVKMAAATSNSFVCVYKYYLKWTWAVVCPMVLVSLLIGTIVGYQTHDIHELHQGCWAFPMAMLMLGLPLVLVPVWLIVRFITEVRKCTLYQSKWEIFVHLSKPTAKWGPGLLANRCTIRYNRFIALALTKAVRVANEKNTAVEENSMLSAQSVIISQSNSTEESSEYETASNV